MTDLTISTALAILHKAYLKDTNSKTFDMRDFEFWNGNKQFTKVNPLLLALQFTTLSEKEMAAKVLIQETGQSVLENDVAFMLELLKTE